MIFRQVGYGANFLSTNGEVPWLTSLIFVVFGIGLVISFVSNFLRYYKLKAKLLEKWVQIKWGIFTEKTYIADKKAIEEVKNRKSSFAKFISADRKLILWVLNKL